MRRINSTFQTLCLNILIMTPEQCRIKVFRAVRRERFRAVTPKDWLKRHQPVFCLGHFSWIYLAQLLLLRQAAFFPPAQLLENFGKNKRQL